MVSQFSPEWWDGLASAVLSPFGNVLSFASMYLRSVADAFFSPVGMSVFVSLFVVSFFTFRLVSRYFLSRKYYE